MEIYSDSRRPDEITFSESLEEDLKRRDFTINALAYHRENDNVIDCFDGKGDLKNKIIRTIGHPEERFQEDALRMMRACRFASQLGFTIEAKTFEAIKKLKNNLGHISMERIRDELIKIIESPVPSIGFETLRKTGLLEHVMPELLLGYGVEQNQYHAFDVYHHSLKVLDCVENSDYRLRLAGIFHDIAKPIVMKHVPGKKEPVFYNHEVVGAKVARKFMRRLKFSNEATELVVHLVRQHMFHYTPQWTDGTVRRFINKIKEENLSFLFQLRKADRLGSGTKGADCEELRELRRRIAEVLKKQTAMQVTDLAIGGKDLMETFELKPSKTIGAILKTLLEEVLDDPSLNKREKLLARAESLLKEEVL